MNRELLPGEFWSVQVRPGIPDVKLAGELAASFASFAHLFGRSPTTVIVSDTLRGAIISIVNKNLLHPLDRPIRWMCIPENGRCIAMTYHDSDVYPGAVLLYGSQLPPAKARELASANGGSECDTIG